MATSLLEKMSQHFAGKRSAPVPIGLGVATSATTRVRIAPGFLLLVLTFSQTAVEAQGGSAPTNTTLSATGANPYSLTATVIGHSVAAPTGSVTFTDQTANRLLGTAKLGAATTKQTFGKQTPYQVGGAPQSVAVGDFNGDGKPDLAVANFDDGTVGVLLNEGNGTFGPQTTYATGGEPGSVAVADFNGDGKPDLVVANDFGNTVRVFLNDGSGTFSTQTTFATGSFPFWVAVGDFNGDGKPDLAVANWGDNTVGVLLNEGGGAFAPQTTYATGTQPVFVAVGDFNGDGKPDLAVANYEDYTACVLLNEGNGAFGPQTTYATGRYPYAVAVGDFNGDGKPDLAVANADDGNVSVLLNAGNGAFGPQTTYSTGADSQSVAVCDFNGDGKPDLAVANSSDDTVSVLLNDGNGGFQPETTYATDDGPQSVAVGDFNGDGVPDLAVSNYYTGTVSVLLNNLTQTTTAILSNAFVIGTGAHTIQAAYASDGIYAPSSNTLSLAASLVSGTLTLAVPSAATAGQSVQLAASLSPYIQGGLTATGSVTFTDTTTKTSLGAAPLTNGTATLPVSFPASGTQAIQASYPGDGNFAPAVSNSQTTTVTAAANFTITPIPPAETVARGNIAGFILKLQSVQGFNGKVSLSCSGGPAGSYCADFPITVSVKSTAYALSGVFFPKSTTPGKYTVTFTGVSGSLTNKTTATFTVK